MGYWISLMPPLSSVLQAFKSRSPALAKKVRIGLIGAGRMGQLHARLLRRNRGAEFVGIADADSVRSQALAKKTRTTAYPQASELLGKADAVVIAVPTQSHHAIGRLFLESGVHCLIEKPLASTISEAEELVALAARKNLVL